MKKLFQLAAAVATALTLAACGGGNDDPAQVVSTNTTLAVNPTTGPAVTAPFVNRTFAFSAVPEFGTTGETTVALTPPASGTTTPGFSIASGGATASGVLEFGSCRFRITASSFTSGPLQVGQIVTVANCAFNLNTAGVPADGSTQTRTTTWVLGSSSSTPVTVTVTVSPTGQLVVNGSATGTVTLTPVSGA